MNNKIKFNGFIFLALTLAISVLMSGCADMRDKFIRKKKVVETKGQRYISVKKYDVHPTIELYTKRYIFWKTWHSELLKAIDGANHKKIVEAVEEELSNLMEMERMLIDEKAERLAKFVADLEKIEKRIKEEKITRDNKVSIRRNLELIGKEVKHEFSYTKVREYISLDFKER